MHGELDLGRSNLLMEWNELQLVASMFSNALVKVCN